MEMQCDVSQGFYTSRRNKQLASLFIFLLFVLSHGILFVLHGRLVVRVRLTLLLFFVGIGADRRRLNRVVAGISLLKTIANIDARVLSTLGNSNGTRPPERLNHVDCIADSLALATLSVLLGVANDLADPGGLLSREHRVLTDVTETLDSWVSGLHCFNLGGHFFLSEATRGLMSAAASL